MGGIEASHDRSCKFAVEKLARCSLPQTSGAGFAPGLLSLKFGSKVYHIYIVLRPIKYFDGREERA